MRVWNWPVLPVIPCVMTFVSLSARMLIASFCGRPRAGGDPVSLVEQCTRQVIPIRVGRLDHSYLPRAVPMLDLLFPTNRCIRRLMSFEPYQALHFVLPGE